MASCSRWSGSPVPTPTCSRAIRARCSTSAAFAPSHARRTGRRPASPLEPPGGRTRIQVMSRLPSSPSSSGGNRPTPDSVGSRSSQIVSRSAAGSISSMIPGSTSTLRVRPGLERAVRRHPSVLGLRQRHGGVGHVELEPLGARGGCRPARREDEPVEGHVGHHARGSAPAHPGATARPRPRSVASPARPATPHRRRWSRGRADRRRWWTRRPARPRSSRSPRRAARAGRRGGGTGRRRRCSTGTRRLT